MLLLCVRVRFFSSFSSMIRYVIMAQMRALETPDPFNDDFYFHNAMRRKQERSLREGQAREGQGLEGLRGGDAHARARVSYYCF